MAAALTVRAAKRVRRCVFAGLVPPSAAAEFDAAVRQILIGALVGAKYVLACEPDALFSRRGYQLVREVAEARVHHAANAKEAGGELLTQNERLRKLLLAVVIAWLRIQFPVLNTAVAGAALVALGELLESRHERKRG